MLHIFFIVYSCSTFRPSDHAYCQLYQFNMLTFQPIWQFHSMESNRSSSSIKSYTFSSIGSITSINLIETIFHNFHALSSTIQISTALPFPFSLVLPIPTVLLIPSMPLIWLFSFHQFRQIDQFLLILIQSLISLIAIILIVADSPNKTSQKNQEKFIQLANIFHNWWSWQLQQFSHAIPPICCFPFCCIVSFWFKQLR